VKFYGNTREGMYTLAMEHNGTHMLTVCALKQELNVSPTNTQL